MIHGRGGQSSPSTDLMILHDNSRYGWKGRFDLSENEFK